MFPFFRVPLILNQAARFNFGFASNMVLLLWCVCGGFLLHMFEANFLTILLKPNYEDRVDTAQDIIDRNLSVLTYPGSESYMEILKNSPSIITRTLAERTYVCKDWDECHGLVMGVVETGSSVLEVGIIRYMYVDWAKEHGTNWYRGKGKKGGDYPFASFILNKKWTLEEEFNNHMMRFQQVTVSSVFI